MLKNYFLIALRNIVRNKLFSLVNILGLTFGMGSALLIFLWVNDELSIDRFHPNTDRLYRVMENQTYSGGKIFTFAATPGPMAPFIKEKFPEIELASRFTWNENALFQVGEKSFKLNGRYADADFLNMFGFESVAGDQSTALQGKDGIVITEKVARNFFGDEDPIGKTIVMNTNTPFQVKAVLKDFTPQSSLQTDFLLPFEVFFDRNKSWVDQWGNNNIRTFILLAEGTDPVAFGDKLKGEVKLHNPESNVELFIQPFGDAYLYSEFENGKLTGGRIVYVKIFFIVAVFVLVIACINFMNLSTAQAGKRAKEVGLRKVIGALPKQVFRQFMGESFLTVLIAAVLAVLLSYLVIPFFNDLTGKSLSLSLLDTRIILIFVVMITFTALLAGSYPAIFISDFKPVQVLKGQLKSGRRAAFFRKTLVVVQFSFSIILIVSTTVVYRQLSFMQNKDIGFDRDNLVYMWMEGDIASKYETARNRLLNMPGVEAVTMATQLPIDVGNSTSNLIWDGKDPEEDVLFSNIDVDFEFIETMKMHMVEGRGFDRKFISDTVGYIINEKAAEKMAFTDGTAGKDLTMWGRKGKIVGVVKDFNFGSLHSEIEPFVMRVAPGIQFGAMVVRIKKGEQPQALASMESIWKEYAPAYPFSPLFLNANWEEMYKAEGQRGRVFNVLAALSIFISCLGLFGLSAFSAERRIKELGIRKVMGASIPGLLQLMSKEFTVLVLLAGAIGCPLSWYLMDSWLANYPYRVDVGWITLAGALGACLVVSLVTIIYHSLKATMLNPAQSLRYE